MVDCKIYDSLLDENVDQKILRQFLERFKVDENNCVYFDLYVDGEFIKDSDLNFGATIDDYLNPTYKLYEDIKLTVKEYLKCRGYSSSLASSSSHYTNALSLLAKIRKVIGDDLPNYDDKFDSKFGEQFKKNNLD